MDARGGVFGRHRRHLRGIRQRKTVAALLHQHVRIAIAAHGKGEKRRRIGVCTENRAWPPRREYVAPAPSRTESWLKRTRAAVTWTKELCTAEF